MAKKKLAAYQAKRDFKKTSEPSGRGKIGAAEYPRFVIQKHAATRLHYDLRLEHDGVFKSWAVTQGPSLDPADKRLAVEVEDHPLDYGDFEGTIPKGEYGGGTVMLWDRGFWMPEGDGGHRCGAAQGRSQVHARRRASCRAAGCWCACATTASGGKRTNWLLIKHRDEFERKDGEAVLEQDRSIASGGPWRRSPPARGAGRDRSWRLATRRWAKIRPPSGIQAKARSPQGPKALRPSCTSRRRTAKS